MSYLDSGYDRYMRRQIDPTAATAQPLQPVDPFMAYNLYSVGNSQISQISMDKLAGGTLALGGQANQFGVMTVQDNSGNAILTIDSNGITTL